VVHPAPAFATDPGTAAYYERRAREYDDWYLGEGVFARRDRPGWHEEVERLVALVAALPPKRTMDVACGTGFLTRHLRGDVIGLDQSPSMVEVAQSRLSRGHALVGDALNLPFDDGAFERVMTAHFYGHLSVEERSAFLGEAERVIDDERGELIVIDSALQPGGEPELWQRRVLNDGSEHLVFKRYLTAEQLAAEIGGRPLLSGDWFVAAAS
jgi:demethylmenaquinone methyltransferase/2-methoxy-6-polyprenyl-1,4-benzoquinol methylase